MKKTLLSYSLQLVFALGVAHSTAVFANSQTTPTTAQNVVATQQKGFELIAQTINKSPADKAIYQGIRLDNGMEVLLISDEKANKSLMSVGLPIGSMDDPKSQQGLAHYLEHMILMGSKAYPETNSLDGFLTKNGGYNNAYTASDRTVYFLEVNNNAFDEAVARLADAFAQPLLSETNAKKEVNAVNAEMVRAKSSDGFLMHDVNLATANPNHPITKFAVGNNVTLSDKADSKLQDELVKFYQQYYSANYMKAVLYSNQPIEKLAALAAKTLGKVENKHLTEPTVSVPFFRDEDKGVIVSYKPVKPSKMLVVSFDMPEDKAQFKHKSGEFLSYLFDNNSEGTLSDYLIKQGLSDSGIQSSASDDVSRNRGDFSFYIALTDKGLAEKDNIISLLFQQIEKIKQDGIQQSYFDELKESLSQKFEHLQIEKGGRYIAGLTAQMLSYPLEHIIDQPYIVETMDNAAIQAKLDLMTIDNVRIMLVDDKANTDKKTQYFEAPYAVAKISDEQKKRWLDFSQNPQLKLPELNPYFATDFSLNPVEKGRSVPKTLRKEQGTEIYAMGSHYFPNDPKAAVQAYFSLLPKNDELSHLVSTTLLDYMAELAQTKIDFQASVANMGVSIDPNRNSLVISLGGYTQHLAKLAKDKLHNFMTFELTEKMLEQAKQRYLESLDRQEKDNALRQAGRAMGDLASYPYFSPAKKRKMIEQIKLVDIEKVRQRLLNNATGLSLLSVGNLTDEQVQQLAFALTDKVQYSNTAIDRGRYIDISQSERKFNHIKHIPHQDNALIAVYFANGYDETQGRARAGLLRTIISRWYFDDLRTDKQLGYVVYATTSRVGKTYGLEFAVQSPTVSPHTIMEHNQRFFKNTLAKLKAMSPTEFETYRNSLVERLKHKPESLREEMGNFEFDFDRGNEKFDHREKMIDAVNQLTLQEIIEFYQHAVIEQKGVSAISQAIGTNKAINQAVELKGFEKVESIEALQKAFGLKSY